MSLFCAICIEESNINGENINILCEKYIIKLLTQLVDSNDKSVNEIDKIYVKFKCNHIFHINCILKCVEHLQCYCNRCPMCRRFIDMEFMIKIRNLYKKILQDELNKTQKYLLKLKLKRMIYKTILYIQYENHKKNNCTEKKYEYLNDLEKTYKKRSDQILQIMENINKVAHRPCRMALNLYQYQYES